VSSTHIKLLQKGVPVVRLRLQTSDRVVDLDEVERVERGEADGQQRLHFAVGALRGETQVASQHEQLMQRRGQHPVAGRLHHQVSRLHQVQRQLGEQERALRRGAEVLRELGVHVVEGRRQRAAQRAVHRVGQRARRRRDVVLDAGARAHAELDVLQHVALQIFVRVQPVQTVINLMFCIVINIPLSFLEVN
jgi:hypothetical protein